MIKRIIPLVFFTIFYCYIFEVSMSVSFTTTYIMGLTLVSIFQYLCKKIRTQNKYYETTIKLTLGIIIVCFYLIIIPNTLNNEQYDHYIQNNCIKKYSFPESLHSILENGINEIHKTTIIECLTIMSKKQPELQKELKQILSRLKKKNEDIKAIRPALVRIKESIKEKNKPQDTI